MDKFPEELHRRCKVKAAEQDLSLKDFTIKALEATLAEAVLDSKEDENEKAKTRKGPKAAFR